MLNKINKILKIKENNILVNEFISSYKNFLNDRNSIKLKRGTFCILTNNYFGFTKLFNNNKFNPKFQGMFEFHVKEFEKNNNFNIIFNSNLRIYYILFILIAILYYVFKKLNNTSFELEDYANKFAKKMKIKNIWIKKEEVTFKDVIGIDEYKDEINEILLFIKNYDKFKNSGAELPKGILLTGNPGVGKTLLGKALAKEANCKFYYKSGSEFQNMYQGSGAKKIKKMFKKARLNSPSIIFIDEFDSIGGRRGSGNINNSRDTINQLLTEMDGFKKNEKVIVIGCTNLVKSLDTAILRPGRFDKIINIPNPNKESRRLILKYYLKKISNKISDKKLENLLILTSGFTGADIKNLCNIAILNCAKKDRNFALDQDFDFALDRILVGITKKNFDYDNNSKMRTSFHELGHSLIHLIFSKDKHKLNKITILPKGDSLGFTSILEDEDIKYYTLNNLKEKIMIALGGRACEELILGKDNLSTGCGSDMKAATKYAYEYVKIKEGLIKNNTVSENINFQIDEKVNKILLWFLEESKKELSKVKNKISNIALVLFEKETLNGDELYKLFYN